MCSPHNWILKDVRANAHRPEQRLWIVSFAVDRHTPFDGFPELCNDVRKGRSFSRHFLFYFKDETFDCDADSWNIKLVPVSEADFERVRASERRTTLPRVTLLSALRDASVIT